MHRILLIALLFVMPWAACAQTEETQLQAQPQFDVLVFSKTAGFRHGSIPDGVAAVRKLGEEHGFRVDHTEDSDDFVIDNLAQYEVIMFLNTTRDVLNDEQQEAFKKYINEGGGFVGVHSATDTEYDWPWYGALVGAYFSGHPRVQQATIRIDDDEHASTAHLEGDWIRTDEWYNFRAPPDADKYRILASILESSYEGGTMGDAHPIAWCHEFDGGRAWYTAGGHTSESYSEPAFLEHLLGGIRWAGGAEAE